MRLDPEIKQQVEAVLKSPVPSPTDPEFDELLLRLRKENPELADLLESGILFDDLPTPEEETQRAVARRSWLLTLKHRLLDRYDELTGEWVPSRPKQIAVGFAGLIAATTLWFALSTRNTEPAKGGLPVPVPTATTTTAPKPEPAPPASANSEAAATGGTAASANGETAAATGQSQSPQDTGATPPPPSGYSEVPPPPSGYPTTPPPSGYSTTTGAAQTPPPQPMTLYVANAGSATAQAASSGQQTSSDATGPGATPPAPLTIATATTTQSQGGPLTLTRPQAPSAPSSSGRPITGSVAEDVAAAIQNQPVSSSRSSASGPTDGALSLKKETQPTFTVRAVEGQGGKGGSFYLVGGQAQTSTPASTPTQPPAPGAALPTFPSAPVAPAATGPAPAPAMASPYPLGTRLKGRLGIGVLIAEGVPGPVAVDAEDGSTWVGEVTLDETRRLKGKLTKAIKDGREYTVSATLLDAEGTLGVAARVREEAPSIAADLIRGSLRGVSDYVTAASQAKSVTVLPGGGVAQSSQTPPLELFMAGSLANLFALQQDKKAVVRVAQAEKGTEVVILVVPSQEPATR